MSVYTWKGAVATIALVVGVLAVVAAVQAVILKFIWNEAIVDMFTVKAITFWQAFAICTLFSMIGGYFRRASK